MLLKGRKISLSVLIIIIFMFVVTNIAYYFVTQNVLVNEASKRLDQITDYISYYITQVTTAEHEKLTLIENQTSLIAKSIHKEFGPLSSAITENKLNEVKNFFELDYLQLEKKNGQGHSEVSDFKIIDSFINYRYSNEKSDYDIVMKIKDTGNTLHEGIDNHLNGMAKARSNFYKGKPITYEFSLFIKPDEGFNKVSNATKFGSYSLLKEEDVKYLNQAVNDKVIAYDNVDNKELEKYFMPIKIGDKTYISCLVSDYGTMKEVMMDQVSVYVFTIVICSVAFIVLCIIITKVFNRNKTKALETVHHDYLDSMEEIFLSMKQQRHDYNNAMATIHSLILMEQYEEVHKFTEELIDETTEVNDLLVINCLPLIALLQYKRAHANNNGIKFTISICDLKEIPNFKYKTNDLVRVISNLIDNAFEAVLTTKKNRLDYTPEVTVTGVLTNNSLIFEVSNNGETIDSQLGKQMFQTGYSTKKEGTGLGLTIVTSIMKRNNGELTYTSEAEITIFKAKFNL